MAETFHQRWAKILPDVPGLQRVAWNHTWTDEKVAVHEKAYITLLDLDKLEELAGYML